MSGGSTTIPICTIAFTSAEHSLVCNMSQVDEFVRGIPLLLFVLKHFVSCDLPYAQSGGRVDFWYPWIGTTVDKKQI